MVNHHSTFLTTYPVPINGFPFRSHLKLTGKSPSSIWQDIAARIPSLSMFVMAWMGIILGGTALRMIEKTQKENRNQMKRIEKLSSEKDQLKSQLISNDDDGEDDDDDD